MARLFKTGLDYFPLEVVLDDKFEIIEAEHGVKGFGVLIKIYQKIYANNYWINWDKKTIVLFSNRINVNINEIESLINSCMEWAIFDKKLFDEFKILTSTGIQKRYFEIIKRRQKLEIIPEYTLVDYSKYIDTEKVNVNINPINVNTSTQSKVKESKVKNKKTYVENSDEFRLAKLLSNLILENNSENKSSITAQQDNYQNWADTIRLINQRDNRSFQQIGYLINWSQKDQFWFKNIHTPESLRRNFDKMADSVKENKDNRLFKKTGTKSLSQIIEERKEKLKPDFDIEIQAEA